MNRSLTVLIPLALWASMANAQDVQLSHRTALGGGGGRQRVETQDQASKDVVLTHLTVADLGEVSASYELGLSRGSPTLGVLAFQLGGIVSHQAKSGSRPDATWAYTERDGGAFGTVLGGVRHKWIEALAGLHFMLGGDDVSLSHMYVIPFGIAARLRLLAEEYVYFAVTFNDLDRALIGGSLRVMAGTCAIPRTRLEVGVGFMPAGGVSQSSELIQVNARANVDLGAAWELGAWMSVGTKGHSGAGGLNVAKAF